jgi:hypothetical protein
MTHARRPAVLSLLTVGALVLAACGSDTDSGAATSADGVSTTAAVTTDVTTTTAPTTTAAASETTATTAPATTALPATTAATTTAPAGPPTLRSRGIGDFTLGGPTPEELLGALTPVLGAPTSVVSAEYPLDAGSYFENPDDESGFAYPAGRTACFANALCVEFGGPDPTSLRFVGYRQGEGPGALTTASGVTAGSSGTAFAASIIVSPGGCFSTGAGTADGVGLFLQSNGELFGFYDDVSETYVVQAPPVDDIVVLSVFAGDEPFFLYDDC